MYSLLWEKITEYTYRMKTPNGWLIRGTTGMMDGGIALIEISDPKHKWGKDE